MSTPLHPTSDQIDRYIIDALEPSVREQLESHAASCLACADALGKAAAVEVKLAELWPQVRRPLAEVVPLRLPVAPRPQQPRAGRASFGGFAAAAVALLVGWSALSGRGGAPAFHATAASGVLHASAETDGFSQYDPSFMNEGPMCVAEFGPASPQPVEYGMCVPEPSLTVGAQVTRIRPLSLRE